MPQEETVLPRPCVDDVVEVGVFVAGAALRLAINCDGFAGDHFTDTLRPADQAVLKGKWVE